MSCYEAGLQISHPLGAPGPMLTKITRRPAALAARSRVRASLVSLFWRAAWTSRDSPGQSPVRASFCSSALSCSYLWPAARRAPSLSNKGLCPQACADSASNQIEIAALGLGEPPNELEVGATFLHSRRPPREEDILNSSTRPPSPAASLRQAHSETDCRKVRYVSGECNLVGLLDLWFHRVLQVLRVGPKCQN